MSSVPVYTGFWHDYSASGASSWTLTLSVQWSGFLLAALSTFIGIVGTSFWSVLAFAIHQCRIRPGGQDALYFQQQAVYRNSSSAFSTVIDLFNIGWAWRSRRSKNPSRQIVRRSVIFSLPPLIVFVGFTVAAVFVGDVTRPTYESNSVKIRPTNCGIFSSKNGTSSLSSLSNDLLKYVNDTMAARAYARSCYGAAATSGACSLYPHQSLPYTEGNAKCPFGEDTTGQSLCSIDSAFMIDSGLLDTSEYLGINAPKSDRILFRRSSTCSPISINDYMKPSNVTDAAGFTAWEYFLGPVEGVGNFTYVYDTHKAVDSFAYQLWPESDLGGWSPIAPLKVANANTVLVLLSSNSVEYLNEVTDPWFLATTAQEVPGGSDVNRTYTANSYISALSCIDQYQFCNPNKSPYSCTILGSIGDLFTASSMIGLNTAQNATAIRLVPYLEQSSTYSVVNYLGTSVLLAQDRVTTLLSSGLPSNQWQLEVQGWFATGLAMIQALVVSYPAQPTDIPYGMVIHPNPTSTDPVERAALAACSNQRVRNTGSYQSFSVVGLIIIIVVGVTIIVASWTAECCVTIIRQRRRVKYRILRNNAGGDAPRNDDIADHREIARIADLTLQLQRIALLAARPDVLWEGTMDNVPCTRDQQVLFMRPTRVEAGENESEDDFWYGLVENKGRFTKEQDNKAGRVIEENVMDTSGTNTSRTAGATADVEGTTTIEEAVNC